MKTVFILLFTLCCLLDFAADAAEQPMIERIVLMRSTLEKAGINNFLTEAKQQGWTAPAIPSQWHVEHVSTAEQRTVDIEARNFGEALAKALADLAPEIQKFTDGKTLYQQTISLCDLSDWCALPEGYGNVFLAQRCLDIAAVGVARLSANLDFPIEKVNELVGRLQGNWMNSDTRRRVLNKEVGAEVFVSSLPEEIESAWASGRYLREESMNPKLKADRQMQPWKYRVRETPAIMANLSFFDDIEIGRVGPVTLLNTWKCKWHERIVNGLELQSIKKAQALAEFRSVVGWFPEKPVFSDEQIRIRDQEIADAAKRGIKIVPFEAAFHSLREAAFDQAWRPTVSRGPGMSVDEWNRRLNLSASAWQAYEEVQRGDFLDHDTAETKLRKKAAPAK